MVMELNISLLREMTMFDIFLFAISMSQTRVIRQWRKMTDTFVCIYKFMLLEDRLCVLIQMLLMFVPNDNIEFSAVSNNDLAPSQEINPVKEGINMSPDRGKLIFLASVCSPFHTIKHFVYVHFWHFDMNECKLCAKNNIPAPCHNNMMGFQNVVLFNMMATKYFWAIFKLLYASLSCSVLHFMKSQNLYRF